MLICDSLEDPASRGGACPLGYFPCGNMTKCLPQQLHCNGEDDCGNHADEDNCEDNNGWSLQFDKHYAERHYNELKSLNAFQTKTSECLAGAVPAECKCQGLEVSCDDAKLRAVPSVPSNVTIMYLQDNKIRAVSKHAFKGLYNLTKLYLSNNKITNLKPHVFEDLHKLEWLIIQNNRINRISPSTFYGLKSLILLEMMNNSLAHLPDKPLCQYMPRLNWLDLESNHIHHLRNVTFISCSTLTVLDLASNEIESLSPYVFKDLKELSQLNLSYNPIKKIQTDQFDFLTKLKSLYFKKFQYCGYAPHVRSCKPNTDGISSLENLLASIIQRVFVWVVSAITCFGNIFVICMRPYIRSENKLHAISIMSLCCVNLAAFIIIVFSYGSMFYSVHQTAIMATEIRNHIKKEMTLAKRFFFIVFTDALCWIPIFVLKLLSLLQVEIPGTITSWVVIFILPINSALNPLLYTLTTRPFKEMIHQFWYNYRQRRSKKGKSSQKPYGPSFIWVEMWPTHEITPKLTKPMLCTDSSDASVTTQSTRLNSYT
ncbi:hypothetical protein ASZ78_003223 [Callipepla squamata]|uniref:G-protein coupled receptors family 1 profile domain-containing protein n=1 Tax=Callipepla squamata TaxID=9009 RepID=A0A226NEP9_CALSU|nr:hypothetical protein ASZ78_003223 [Callipepla squamata]